MDATTTRHLDREHGRRQTTRRAAAADAYLQAGHACNVPRVQVAVELGVVECGLRREEAAEEGVSEDGRLTEAEEEEEEEGREEREGRWRRAKHARETDRAAPPPAPARAQQ